MRRLTPPLGAELPDYQLALKSNVPHQNGNMMAMFWRARTFSRRFDEAVAELRVAIQEDPSLPLAHRFLAACHAHMAQLEEAREIVRHLRTITPVVMPDVSYLRNPEHRELYLSRLRLAVGEAG
jgi:hypothetical protein